MSHSSSSQDPGSARPRTADDRTYRAPLGLKLTQQLSRWLGGEQIYLIAVAALIGVGSGYGAILFRWLIHSISDLAYPGGVLADDLRAVPWYVLALIPAAGGAVVGPLVYFFAREAKGHGVPEVMDAVANHGGRIRPRVAVVKTIASALSIGVGTAVGREGPIVQIGSSLGSSIGQLLHLNARAVKLMVGCGAAAGIAATFNAPIAGVIFSIEVILGLGTIRIFTPLVVSSVIATAVSRYHLGDQPAFHAPAYGLGSPGELGLYALLGIICAFAGVGFSRALYAIEDLADKVPIHDTIKPIFGGVLVGTLVFAIPEVGGVGYDTIEAVLASEAKFSILMLLAIFAVKALATHLSLATGFSGGVFAPSLFLGAILGSAFGTLAQSLLPPGSISPTGAYAIVGMGALVAAGTHAPLTSILIIFEMTGDYRIILPLMLACLIASTLSLRLSRESIYTLKLARRGTRIGHPSGDDVMLSQRVESHLTPIDNPVRLDWPLTRVVEAVLAAGGAPVYVTDAKNRFCGSILTEDVMTILRDEDDLTHVLVAADLVHTSTAAVRPDETLARALRKLGQRGADTLPVVDDQEHLVGTISRRDVIALYDRELLQRESAAMRFLDPSEHEHTPAPPATINIPADEHIAEIPITRAIAGQTLRQLNLRARFEVNVLGIRRPGNPTMHAVFPGQELVKGETLVVSGTPERIRDVQALASNS